MNHFPLANESFSGCKWIIFPLLNESFFRWQMNHFPDANESFFRMQMNHFSGAKWIIFREGRIISRKMNHFPEHAHWSRPNGKICWETTGFIRVQGCRFGGGGLHPSKIFLGRGTSQMPPQETKQTPGANPPPPNLQPMAWPESTKRLLLNRSNI